MNFTFSIRQSLRESWTLFKAHPWFFIGMSLVVAILNIATGDKSPTIIVVLATIASIVMSYVWLSISLAAVDGKVELLRFSALHAHIPSVRQFFFLIMVGLATGFFALLGLVALIIPGIYIMIRLMFTSLAYVDRKEGVMQTLRYSWHLVEGKKFWTVFLTGLVSFGLIILGVALLGVGFLVLYPIAGLLVAKLYRALSLATAPQE